MASKASHKNNLSIAPITNFYILANIFLGVILAPSSQTVVYCENPLASKASRKNDLIIAPISNFYTLANIFLGVI
jgi:hypothetical protein